MNEEELLYRIRFQGDKTDLDTLIDPEAIAGLVLLSNEIESLQAQIESLNATKEASGQLDQQQAEELEKTKLQLQALKKEYKEQQNAINANDKALNTSLNTYEGLVDRNKALANAMKKLPLNDTTGTLKKMQAEYDKNNEALKKFDERMGHFQRNVGNYKEGYASLVTIFGQFPGPITAAISQIEAIKGTVETSVGAFKSLKTSIGNIVASLSTLQKALISTGIGALVAAAAAIYAYWDDIKAIFSGVTAEHNKLLASQKEGVEEAKKKADILNLQENTLRLQGKTEKEILQLKISQTKEELLKLDALLITQKNVIKLQIESAKRNKEILSGVIRTITAPLNAISKVFAAVGQTVIPDYLSSLVFDPDEVASEGDAAIAEIERQQAELISKRDGYQLQLNEIDKKGAETRANISKQEAEKFIDTLELLRKLREEGQELLNKAVDNYWKRLNDREKADAIALQNAKTSAEQRREYETYLYELTLEDQLLAAEIYGRREQQVRREMIEESNRLTEQGLKAGLSQVEAQESAIANVRLRYLKKIFEAQEADREEEMRNKIRDAQSFANSMATIEASLFERSKVFAVAKATIDTYASAVAAFKDTPGPIYVRAAAAAAAIAAGIANIRKILSTQPGSTPGGSSIMISGPGPGVPYGMIGNAFNPSAPMRYGPLTTGTISTAAPTLQKVQMPITVVANVDRKGLAIAVREGERQIKTQQFTFAQ